MLSLDSQTKAQDAKVESIKETVNDMQGTVEQTQATVDEIELEVNEGTANEETSQEILEKIDETLDAVVGRFNELDEKVDRVERDMNRNEIRRIHQKSSLHDRLEELEERLNGQLGPQYNPVLIYTTQSPHQYQR